MRKLEFVVLPAVVAGGFEELRVFHLKEFVRFGLLVKEPFDRIPFARTKHPLFRNPPVT